MGHLLVQFGASILSHATLLEKYGIQAELKGLLEPFGITRFYTDGWGAYERHIDESREMLGVTSKLR
jgi:insertion element IS1 protein InsB